MANGRSAGLKPDLEAALRQQDALGLHFDAAVGPSGAREGATAIH
jgi:hypothetical protein